MINPLPFLGSQFRITETTFSITAAGSPVQVLLANPNRYAIVFAATRNQPVDLSTIANFLLPAFTLAPAGSATLVGASPILILTWPAVGALVQMPWYAFPPSPPTGTLGVLEIEYRPLS